MKFILGLAAVAAAFLIILPVAAAGGPKLATIALDQPEPISGSVTFTVMQANYHNPYLLWVVNKCFLAGVLVNAEYHAVVWNASEATGGAGPFEIGGVHVGQDDIPVPWVSDSCTAYVWKFPASETPERYHGDDVAVSFAVGS